MTFAWDVASTPPALKGIEPSVRSGPKMKNDDATHLVPDAVGSLRPQQWRADKESLPIRLVHGVSSFFPGELATSREWDRLTKLL